MDSCSLDDSPPPVSIDSSLNNNNNNNASSATAKTTIAQRRRVAASPDKLRLYAQWSHDASQASTNAIPSQLEQENAALPPQDSENDLLEHVERQQGLLHLDPKPSCLDTLDTSPVDDPFWKCLIENYAETATRLPRMLITELRRQPIPHRDLVWQAMAHSADTHLAAMYDRLVQGDMGISSYERVIDRDVARMTMGQQTARLLKAYSVYDAQLGYSQGLAALARPLLMVMDEKAAFCTFVRLMETYEMRSLFTLNMEGLHLILHQFETLVAQICPLLYDHLAENSIRPAMYASQWFLTLFASSFPTPLVLRMYDLVFAQGAILTAMRVAVAVMQKLQDRLLQIHQFEQLMTFLTNGTLYDNEADLIETVFELSSVITYAKLDSVAQTHHRELEQEQSRAQQLVALRLSNRKVKRESWFSWKQTPTSPPTSPTTHAQQQQQQRRTSINQDRAAVSVLHQQIEDLVTALSQLQKDHSQLQESVTSMHLKQLDHEAERDKLLKRNAILEKKVKKYKAKLINQEKNNLPPAAPNDAHFKEFVDSLRMSGDFGALVAGALASPSTERIPPLSDASKQRRSSQLSNSSVSTINSSNRDSENDTVATTVVADDVPEDTTAANTHSKQEDKQRQDEDDKSSAAAQQSMHQITSELVSIKLANFEMGQKYEQLCQKYEESQRQLFSVQDERDSLARQLADLQVELEAARSDKEIVLQEHEEILKENEELAEKAMASKRTASELQFEKMALVKDVQNLEKRVQTLEKEKQEYLLPRGTFSEEVFAAHRILFDEHRQQQQNKRHTLATTAADKSALELQSKYVESDLRCRELEKLLAEAKVKIAEYEAATNAISPRASMIQMKRTSTASLSILAGASRVTSPTDYSHHRDSTESFASSVTSATSLGSAPVQQKRSSMYARLWTPRNSLAKQPEEVS